MIPILIPDTFDLQRLYTKDGKALFDSDGLALYARDPSPSVPAHNGLGEMGDAISCIVRGEINAPDDLTMTYPITGSLFRAIKERCVIMAEPERLSRPQPFRIYRITKPLNGIITVYARHLAYEGLSGIPVAPFTAEGIQGAMAGLTANAMVPCPFTLSTPRATASTFTVKVPTDIWSLLGGQQGSLLDVYGGEYSFNGYHIRLENRIGADNGVKVRYGVNMVDLEQDTNIANCYTGVVAYWRNEDDEIHSPVIYAGGTYSYVRILPVDLSSWFEDKPTVEQLTAAGTQYINQNQIGVPNVSWKVKMVDLADTEEYKDVAILERVRKGDTVGVEFEALGVNASARVRALEWDVLNERYKTITLGSVKANIASTIANQARIIKEIPANVESMAEKISRTLTGAILGARGGSVRLLDTDNDGEPDTLYIADNPDPAQAVKVWRFNYEGWGASSNGYNGPFTMGATLDSGIVADFITAGIINADLIKAGKLSANRIEGGTLKLGGVNNTNGVIDLYNEDGVFIGKLYNGGFWLGDGLNNLYSTFHENSQFSIRKGNGENLRYLARLTRATDPDTGNDIGGIRLHQVDSDGNDTVNCYLEGNGTIVCKRLIVNGHEIT